jgi:hypothetical protein
MFQSISDVSKTVSDYFFYSLRNIEAIDLDRNLAITGTRGKPKYAPKWMVLKLNTQLKTDSNIGIVRFRAWSIEDAVLAANNDKRLIDQINKAFGGTFNG